MGDNLRGPIPVFYLRIDAGKIILYQHFFLAVHLCFLLFNKSLLALLKFLLHAPNISQMNQCVLEQALFVFHNQGKYIPPAVAVEAVGCFIIISQTLSALAVMHEALGWIDVCINTNPPQHILNPHPLF